MSNDADSNLLNEEMLKHLTHAQLYYILRRIQQLVNLDPDFAQQVLTDDPKLSLTLLHAEYLIGCRAEKLLPLTSDEVKLAKERFYQLRRSSSANLLEFSVAGRKSGGGQISNALAGLDQEILEKLTGGEIVDINHLASQLLQLSDQQLAQLPEEVQQLLQQQFSSS